MTGAPKPGARQPGAPKPGARQPGTPESGALEPSASKASPPQLTLYGRAWCHLCEEMLVVLEPIAAEFGARVDVVDIDADPALVARYDEFVPVLVLDGVELARYRLDRLVAARVRAALSSRRCLPPGRPKGAAAPSGGSER